MFDIGFWELALIAVIGLVVLGPERLPVAIRTVSSWISNIKGYADSVKTEINEELRIHELHSNLKKAEQNPLQALSPEIEKSVQSLKEAAESVTKPYAKKETKKVEEKASLSKKTKSSPSLENDVPVKKKAATSKTIKKTQVTQKTQSTTKISTTSQKPKSAKSIKSKNDL